MNSLTHPELAESHATHLREGYFMGCLPAEVTDLNDPLKAGRIKCRSTLFDPYSNLPSGSDGWIQVITDYVNTNRSGGKVTPLEIGSQVVLLPILGKPDNWICFGALHSFAEPPDPIHDRAKGTYGEVNNAGIATIIKGDASKTEIYPQGVVKSVTANGDIQIKTPQVQVDYGADGSIGIQNPVGSMTIARDGTVDVLSAAGGAMTFSTDGTVTMKSGHTSSMVFGSEGTAITGPKKESRPSVATYADKISSNIEGLGSMFKELQSSEISPGNIEAIIGKVKTAIGKANQITADFQSGAENLKMLSTQPLPEIIQGISPQLTTYLESNLTRLIPEIQAALGDNLTAAELADKINGLIPGQLSKVSPDALAGLLTNLKADRDRLLEAVVGQIVPFASVQNIFGTGMATKLPRIREILVIAAPTWAKDPDRCTQLLFETGVARVVPLIPSLGYLANLPGETISLSDLREGLNTVAEAAQIDAAVQKFWVEIQARKLGLIVDDRVDTATLKAAVDIAATGDLTTAMATILAAVQAQAISSGSTASDELSGLLAGASRLEYSLGLIDQGEYSAGIYQAILAGTDNPQYQALHSLANTVSRSSADNLTSPTRTRVANFQRSMDQWAKRWLLVASTEDSLCQQTIATLIQRWQKNYLRDFTQSIGDNLEYYNVLQSRFDNFVSNEFNAKLSYPQTQEMWDNLQATINALIEEEKRLDRLEALIVLRRYFRSESAKLEAKKVVPRQLNQTQGYKPSEVINSERAAAIASLLDQFVAEQKLVVPDQGVNCSEIPFVVWQILEANVENFIEKMRLASTDSEVQSRQKVLTFADLRALPTLFTDNVQAYRLSYPASEDMAVALAGLIGDYISRENALDRDSYFSRLANSLDPVALAEKLDPGIVGTATYELISSEFTKLIANQRSNLASFGGDYAATATTILNELDQFIQQWISAWQRVSRSSTVGFTILTDFQSQVFSFVSARDRLTAQHNGLNLLWDEVRQTTNYIVSYREPIDGLGFGQIDRSYSDNQSPSLPGGFLAAAEPTPTNKDWISAAVEIIRAISDSVLSFVPSYQDWHGKVAQILNAVPVPNNAPAVILNTGSIDLKSNLAGGGSTMSLDGKKAKISAAGGASNLDLAAGKVALAAGIGGGALALGTGSGSIKVGGGSMDVNIAGATLSGLGSSVFAGAGFAGFSTPFGTFGLGGGGGGGDNEDYQNGLNSSMPVRFRVREADLDGGAVEISLNSRRGAGMASYDAYTGRKNAEIQLFDGRISLTTYFGGQPQHAILINEGGVLIDGYSLSELYGRYDNLYGRFNVLSALVDSLATP